ncbi:MAG: LytTR family DNA-binding domain-containing protein [Rhodothermales bacterium]
MLNVFIVDDEAPARSRLRKLLAPFEKAGRVEVSGEAEDGVDAVEKLSAARPDVVFLDIQMPGHDGFEVLERLPPDARPIVVFTTAYDEYAIRAFDANAVDYLLKPIPADRLEQSIARAEKLLASPVNKQETEDRLARLLDWMDERAMAGPASDAREPRFLEQLSVPYRDRILIVPVSDLVSVEISEGITRVFILDHEPAVPRPKLKQHIVSYTLDQLESMLDPDAFMRVHRSAIVQFGHIKELITWFSGRYKLVLTGGHEVIASRERSKILKDRLMV